MPPQPNEGAPSPDVTPDYGRAAALPFGTGPAALGADALGTWLALLGADAAWLTYRHPDEQPFDPGYRGHYFRQDAGTADPDGRGGVFHPDFRGGRLARALTISGTGDALLVPRHWSHPDGDGAVGTTSDLDPVTDAQLAGIIADPEDPEPARTVWDGEHAAAADLPIPQHADESLLITWDATGPRSPRPLLDAPLPGVFAEPYDPATPLLATSTAANGELDGELDRLLLRAPVAGSVRFQRYEHVVRRPDGGLALRRPSTTGRLVLRTRPLPDLTESPLRLPQRFVVENVDAASLGTCLAPLVLDQFRRYAVLAADGTMPPDLPGQLGWVLRLWLAVADLAPSVATVPGALLGALSTEITPGARPSKGRVTAAVGAIGAHDGWAALSDFVARVYGPVVGGAAWGGLDPALDLDADTPLSPAQLTSATGDVVMFQREAAGWVSCFAGAPLGRPAAVWLTGEDRQEPLDAVRTHAVGLTTFQVEALYQASSAAAGGDPIRATGSARAAGPLTESTLRAYARPAHDLEPAGFLAVVRIAEPSLPKREYTMPDWLTEVVVGTARRVFQPPLLDAGEYTSRDDVAHVDHPLAALADWHGVCDAWVVRDRLNALNDDGMGARSLAWWAAHTRLADPSGLWPGSHLKGERLDRTAPTPKSPYSPASSGTGVRTATHSRHGNDLGNKGVTEEDRTTVRDGWDDADLASVVVASQAVRDARTSSPVHPAVVMAVADTEGYLVFTSDNRNPQSWVEHFSSMPDKNAAFTVAGSRWQLSFMNMISRWSWTGWPYGLDLLTKRRDWDIFQRLASTGALQDMSDQFRWVIDQLRPADRDPATWLLDPAFVPAGNIERFAVDRLAVRWSTDRPKGWGADRPQHRRLTRRLEPVGLALQAAIFQWVHQQVHTGVGYLPGDVYHPLPEFTDPGSPPPGPGVDSLDPERRDFVAYWALVYLAFNTTPSMWSMWARTAEQDRTRSPATRASTHLLFGVDNRHTDISADLDTANRMRILGNMSRFAAALDAYLRVDFSVDRFDPDGHLTGFDTVDPAQRQWPGVP